jgi:ABC-type dipeptide/oligopeptide/nickel transport system permease component
MPRYILFRLAQLVITIFVISLIVFFLVRLKGDPISIIAPPTFNVEQVENLRQAWGFDKPLWEQYIVFLRKAVTGDFGLSVQHRIPAMDLVLERLKWTYMLAAVAALIALVIAIPLGVMSAVRRNSVFDLFATLLATAGTAMPGFWLGIMLILIFSVNLRLLPAYGAETPAAIIMPALALGTGMAARISRLTRSSMLETLGQDYIRTARSKGLRSRTVVWRHALRNGLIPVITAFGLQLGWLLGGSVVIETVFAWPGLGRLMIESIHIRDITIVQAGLLFFATSFVLINLVVDVLYTFFDPRIRYD